jgi:hypothetical protein
MVEEEVEEVEDQGVREQAWGIVGRGQMNAKAFSDFAWSEPPIVWMS